MVSLWHENLSYEFSFPLRFYPSPPGEGAVIWVMLDGTRYKKQVLGDKEIVVFVLTGERGWLETSLAGFSLSKKTKRGFQIRPQGKQRGFVFPTARPFIVKIQKYYHRIP